MKPSAWVVGRQAFDGLGRQITVEVGGRSTGFDYQPGRLPTCANQLPDGTRIAYTYEANLDERLLTIAPAGEAIHAFAYDPVLGLPSSRSGPLGTLEFKYERSGRPLEDVLTIDGQVHWTQWRYSLNKQLCGLTDAQGTNHTYHYDHCGRLAQHVQGDITTTFTFDTFSRIDTLTTTHGKNTLVQALSYDTQGREHSRTFTLDVADKHHICEQILCYTDLDQVASRTWKDGDHNAVECFDYDSLGRLIRYTADLAVAPEDPFGNRVIEQTFALNALDGYTEVHSRFANGGTDQATFFYDNPADPTQVSRITHTHASWPARITLTYDDCGRMIADSLGRQLTWDAQDRLSRVDYRGQRCDYRYGPSGELIDRVLDGALTRCFFSGDLLTHEQTGKEVLQRIGDSTTLFALNRITEGVRKVTLIGCDAQRSVRVEADDTLRTRRYSAHGAETEAADNGPYGYVGERREPLTGWYLPGGNRPYDPIVMGFLSPDDESPFGRGGLNPYAYCGGDPINRIDPDGHAWWTWVIAGIGTVLGVVGTVATLGAAAPAFAALLAGGLSTLTATSVMAMTAATLSVVALGTGIASTVLEATDTDSKAASILGWISLGTGLVSTALELAPKAASTLTRLGRSVGRGSSKATKTLKMAPGTSTASPKPGIAATPYKTSTPVILHTNSAGVGEVAFHPNYLGTGYAAFETHGTRGGLLMDSSGQLVRPERVALEIQDWMVANGKPNAEPFTLVACWAAKSGAAQKVSDVTGRPVTAYLDAVFVDAPSAATRLTPDAVPSVAAPKSWWATLTGQPTQYTPAPSRIFIPQVRIV